MAALPAKEGVGKSSELHLAQNHSLSHRQILFSARLISGRQGRGGPDWLAQRSHPGGWVFVRPNAALPLLHRPASPIRALSRAGFAITGRGRISGGLFSRFPDSSREAMFCQGTMGTWEQAMSDRQKAAPLEGADLFPSSRAALGTWEQNWPIPMQENPRACGSPVPAPAGERG